MTTTFDVAATISSVLWPLVVLVTLVVYRHKISSLIAGILSRVKKLEFAGVSLELAEVEELSTQWLVKSGGLDLRSLSAGLEVFESTKANILAQLDQPITGDYAVIDLGEGREWLSSRLLILSVLFDELRGLKAMVFVDSKDELTRRYLGWIDPKKLARILADRFPKLEAALSIARSIIDKPQQYLLPENNLWVTQMGLVSSQAGSELFKHFLFHIKPQLPPAIPPGEVNDWTPMQANPGFAEYAGMPNQPAPGGEWVELNGNRFYEYAQWVNRRSLEELLGEELDRSFVHREDLRGKSEQKKVRMVLLEEGDFVAIVKEENRFDRLVNRRTLMETAVAVYLQES